MAENFATLFEKTLEKTNFLPGDVILGKVIAVTENTVVVNAGLKSESVIPRAQFLNDKGELEVKVGDEIDVALEVIEDGFGITKLSREKAKRLAVWKDLEKYYLSNKLVTGKVTARVKGGFTVEIGPVKGFLPGSLIDVRPVKDTSFLEGKDVDVKIIKMDPKRNNIVVSRKAALESGTESERAAALEKLHEGQEIKGIVKNLTEYGAFIDLGGVDGLLHITDMSWRRIKHPSELLNVGDEVMVKILKFDREKNRVSLGLKQIGDDPWQNVAKRYPVGTRLFGKVTNIADYGCFIEIENDIEGLVHVSEMDWTNKNVNPYKIVQLGDEIEVKVLEIDEERRRISLGIKQCQDNPWKKFSDKHQKGEKISGVIRSITDFGIFIGLEGEIDGLVHLSDISWNETGEEAIRRYQKGQEIETVILAIDSERERISLGIKQLESNPLQTFMDQHEKGTYATGKVIEVDDKKAVLDFGDGIQGHLKGSEVAKSKVTDVREHIHVGDELTVVILSADNKNRIVNVSLKALDMKTSDKKGKGEKATNATLGDLIKEKMENKDEG
jgi:small subunit ribosomal protein S1